MHHTIPILQEQKYDPAGSHFGLNDMLKNNLTRGMDAISNGTINVAQRPRSHSISPIFISGIYLKHSRYISINRQVIQLCV